MEWINLDYLSWGILALTWLFIGTPILGSMVSDDSFVGYRKAIEIGLLIQLFIVSGALMLFSIIWAGYRVLGWA